ncbi:MAG: hypothetical protein HRT44_01690 [Bdellovibrionales bacterium]|nr:hypothetical protein [Bdellovibrionales bacterium]NQZ17958.1 hypothetical protein [Bdellovibrionales bacterium]
MEFNYKIKELDKDNVELVLSGFLEESSQLPHDLDLSNKMALYIDFEDLKFINSGGIKNWVKFANKIENFDDLTVVFKNCHRIIIDQINLVEGLLPSNASVLSLYVPIFCGQCEKSYEVFQIVNQMSDNFDTFLSRVTPASCQSSERCTKLELDIFPELYFKFLKKD